VVLKLVKDEKVVRAFATGKFSNNFKAEAEAMRTAAAMAIEPRDRVRKNIVNFTDALSVIKAMSSDRNSDLLELREMLSKMSKTYERAVI
jgi:phosphoribosylaminoimidazole-succinocarboxamide synthase